LCVLLLDLFNSENEEFVQITLLKGLRLKINNTFLHDIVKFVISFVKLKAIEIKGIHFNVLFSNCEETSYFSS